MVGLPQEGAVRAFSARRDEPESTEGRIGESDVAFFSESGHDMFISVILPTRRVTEEPEINYHEQDRIP